MFFEVPRRRRPTAATSWLMVIFFFPWFGFILYLLIGANRPSQLKLELNRQRRQAFYERKERFAGYINAFRPKFDGEFQELSDFVEKLGGMPVQDGNKLELITKSERFIDRLIADINSAEHHVHLLFYIFEDDEIGRKVHEALSLAKKRGVTCRVLVDAVGSRKMLAKARSKLLKAGIKVYDALPLISWGRFLGRIDWRNHRKVAIVDGKIGYTGSQNLVHPSYGHSDPALIWRDLVVRVTGPAVLQLQSLFWGNWFMETGEMFNTTGCFPAPRAHGEIPVQVLQSGPIYAPRNYQRLVLSALYCARRQVTITTPYFVPGGGLLQAIEIARKRGVEVRLIVPKKSDQFLAGNAARSYFDELLKWGVKVYRFTGGLLHAKSMEIDGRFCFIGSSNFDIRSFRLDFELDLICYGTDATADLLKRQENYIGQSELLTQEQWSKRSAPRRMIENMAKLFSPLL